MKLNPDQKQITQSLRCLLTPNEKLEAGKELAEATNQLEEIQDDKKRVTSDFKARTNAAEARVSVLSNKLRTGYELRNVECVVTFDKPKAGTKQTQRLDTEEVISTDTMTEDEKQRQLELEAQ